MKGIAFACACAIALAASPGLCAETDADQGPAWLASVADQKLIAVDGASLTLSPAEDKMTLVMASAVGAAEKRVFTLITDNMGTVSDDAQTVLGFFRVTDDGIETEYGDGRTEQYSLNGAGGLSLAIHAASGTSCLAWYPAGHVFSEGERRAAVADYASRLGLAQPKVLHLDNCTKSASPALGHVVHRLADAASAGPILVRSSVVHPIDTPAAAPVTKVTWAAAPRAARTSEPAPQTGRGASDCLHVESDGANLGFRNQCGYGVQFAYCLQTAGESDASCDAGAKPGTVAANGFTALLMGSNIKVADAEHDFRWVACSGAASDVTAHLDRPDPPSGRCELVKKS